MDAELIVTCLAIVTARIVDVSLGTMRTISVVQGRAFVAWFLGFFEILVWVFAVSKVLHNLEEPVYAVTYAFGFAMGNYLGVKLENRLAFGRQVVRIFTRKGGTMADLLRNLDFRVTAFDGQGRTGHVNLLFVELERRRTAKLLLNAAEIDPECYYFVDDIRMAASPAMIRPIPTGWRAVLKKK